MAIRITPDDDQPTVAIELRLMQPLADYDIEEVEKATPREVDEVLVSQGFQDLVDDARALLKRELSAPGQSPGLEMVQITGAIAHDGDVHRPGIWLVLRESGAPDGRPMSPAARERAAALAEKLRAGFKLG